MSHTEYNGMPGKKPPERIQDTGKPNPMTADAVLQEIIEAIRMEDEPNSGGNQPAPSAAAQPAGDPSGRWGDASLQTAAEAVANGAAHPLDEKLALVLKEITEALAEEYA
ncbi:MAG: hypothetical protein QGF68_05730 [Nitrospinota bacterium]|jgi:hypothetical protein|nr:hypothetical protein [Nitrospinota bacterium]HJM43310.1 hypothetical protein [Nitrospinota bacterium]